MPAQMLAAQGLSASDITLLQSAGIDLSKILAWIKAQGPTVVPLIQTWLHTLPQSVYVKVIETVLDALYHPVPTP